MMLREMQAFQACWIDLKDDYPTSREDNTLICPGYGAASRSLSQTRRD